jgi:hypothetical protein
MNKNDKNKLTDYLNNSKRLPGEFIHNLFLQKSDSELDEFVRKDWDEQWNLSNRTSLNDELLSKIHKSIDDSVNKKSIFQKSIVSWYTYAASILFIPMLFAATYFFFNNESADSITNNSFAEIIAPEYGRLHYYLPDSSLVILNGGSKLVAPLSFENERTVELIGKAYFDVQTNKQLPFKLKVPAGTVKVLGTQFTANSKENDFMEVVLKEGAVEAYFFEGQQKVLLEPDQRLIVESSRYRVENVKAQQITAWIDGRLIFKNNPLEDVCRQLSDKYNVDIEIVNKELNTITYRGTFVDEPIEEVFQLMTLSLPIKYQVVPSKKLNDGSYSRKKINLFIKN